MSEEYIFPEKIILPRKIYCLEFIASVPPTLPTSFRRGEGELTKTKVVCLEELSTLLTWLLTRRSNELGRRRTDGSQFSQAITTITINL